MLISVIVPLYNKEKHICSTITSILNQSYNDFELIIVDDGSSDKSVEIVSKIEDPRVILVRKKNGGPASARNLGVKKASGKWIYFLDADDRIEKDCLMLFSKLINANPNIKVFVANYYLKWGKVYKKNSLFMRNGIVTNNFRSWFWGTLNSCQGSVIYDRNLLLKNPYPEDIRRWEDAAMFFRLMTKEKIYTSGTPVFTYIMDNSSASHGRKNIKEDYLGHLTIKNKTFWERMCIHVLYSQAIKLYPEQCKILYGNNFFNYFDKIAYKFFYCIKWLIRLYSKFINSINKRREMPN